MLPLHSGRWVGAPVASLRCRILRPGKVSINATRHKILAREDQTALQTSCSEPAWLAGFEVIMPGRFWGDHRGSLHPSFLESVIDDVGNQRNRLTIPEQLSRAPVHGLHFET